MPFSVTSGMRRVAAMRKRYRFVAGGTSAGKTIDILCCLLDLAQTDAAPGMTSVVSESMPHLKRGAMRDFKNVMLEQGYWNDEQWNATDFIYTLKNKSQIEFFSADQPIKVRGPRRRRLFMNEANNLDRETFEQLEIRTDECVYADWNPDREFWAYEAINDPAFQGDLEFLTLTYLDNEALDPRVRAAIERRRDRPQWWRVYGLGQLGEAEGRVYTGWNVMDEVPHEARLERRGLDFGYSNDPTAIVDVYRHNGGWVLDERCYQTGMMNRQIADLIRNSPEPNALVKADCAEPKSIDEIAAMGVSIVGAAKGPDSVRHGIRKLQGERVSVTKRSLNLLKEYRAYMWAKGRDGKQLDVPEPGDDHLLDAVRYAFDGLLAEDRVAAEDEDLKRQRQILANHYAND